MQKKLKISTWKKFIITFAAFLVLGISFKVMVLIEGLTEIRPVNAIPVVAGLVCGPIGAIACAAGNLVSDIAGTFSQKSVLGAVANLMAAYLPCRLWHQLSREQPNLHSVKNIFRYVLISFVNAMTTAWILAFGIYIFWQEWVEQVYTYVFWNNFGFSLGLGMPLLIILTSDSINIECYRRIHNGAGNTKRSIWQNAYHITGAVFSLIMLLLFGCVMVVHLSPVNMPWSVPVSAGASVLLLFYCLPEQGGQYVWKRK